jgi:integrase
MKGNVYTKEKCPVCGEKFTPIDEDLICPVHFTRPKKVYIQLYDKTLHKCINIHRDRTSHAFESYEHAYRVLTKIRTEIDEGTYDVTRYVAEKLKPLRFKLWSKSWLQRRKIEVEKGQKSPSYLKAVKVYVTKYQLFFVDTDIRDIGTKKVDDFRLALNGSPKYVFNIMSCLHKMLSDALDWGDIKQMPKFPKIEVPEPDIKTIDLDQQDAIINAIPDQMDRAFILFTAREMIRPSETRALWWEDLDLKHDRVTIRRHFSLNELRLTTKSKNIKILPLDGEVKEILKSLPRHITSPFVFHKKGKAFGESWARKLWKRVSLQMGIDIPLYQGTRHSTATEAVNRVGMDMVQEFLGHTRTNTTRRYAKVNVNGLKKVLRK